MGLGGRPGGGGGPQESGGGGWWPGPPASGSSGRRPEDRGGGEEASERTSAGAGASGQAGGGGSGRARRGGEERAEPTRGGGPMAAKPDESLSIEMVSGPGSHAKEGTGAPAGLGRRLRIILVLLSIGVAILFGWVAGLTSGVVEIDARSHSRSHPWAGTERHVWMQYGVAVPEGHGGADSKYESLGAIHAGSGSWAEKASMPSARSDMQAVPYGDEGRIAIIGGKDSNSTVLSSVLSYDPLLDRFTEMPPLPGPRYRFGATHAPNGDVWVAGGLPSNDYDAQQMASTAVYRAATNKWEAGPDLAVPRGDNCMATVGNTIYALGGWTTDYADVASVEALDLSEKDPAWKRVADMPAPRGDLLCRCAGDKFYAAGGYHDPEGKWRPSSFQDTLFEYDPATDSWATKAPMGQARGDGGLIMTESGKLLMMGGEFHARNEFNQIPQHDVELYYPEHNVWVPKAPMPLARFRFASTQVGGEVFVFGGQLLCSTGWEGFAEDDCAKNALSSTEAFLDLDHPAVFLVTRAP